MADQGDPGGSPSEEADAEADPSHVGPSEEEVLRTQIERGLDELTRPASGLFLSALSAGLDIGFGPLFMAALVTVASGVWGAPALDIGTSLLYTVGFVFVIVGRTELFTEHTTLAVLPVLDGRASLRQLGRLWGLVYAGNIAGSAAFAALMVATAPAYGLVDPSAFGDLARPLVSHSPFVTFLAAALAGWLMGLLSWLVTAVDGSGARIAVVILVTFVIGFGHLPHSIAGNVEVLAGTLAVPGITPLDYAEFLLTATLGNVAGGAVFVALLKYSYVVRT
jgi:formate/nitrite transporter FocA (FNT family)